MGTTNKGTTGKRGQKTIRNAVIGVVLVGITVGGYTAVSAFENHRLTEAMESEAVRQAAEAAEEESRQADAPIVIDDAIEDVSDYHGVFSFGDETLEWQGKKYKKDSYKKAILCMGIDRSDDMVGTRTLGSAGQADGIFLICHDTARNVIKMMMIPRDTIAEITVSDENGNTWQDEQQLSVAFGYGDGSYGSCESVREAVSGLLFDLPIDHYFAADLGVLQELNDAVGGVTVTIPTDGMEAADPAFVKGATVHLEGEQAEKFLRFRDTTKENSAVQRMSQHKEYINGYYEALQARQREDSSIVQELFGSMQDNMLTDMAKDQYLKLALDTLNGGEFSGDSILYLPGTARNSWTYDEYHMDDVNAIEALLELFCHEV